MGGGRGGNWRINYDYVIVVGIFSTGELSDMCVRCLRQYVQSCWDCMS